ncbi:MAG: hypothetical protein Q9191_003842 [Dirinaria sp. TL-2023a]
MAEVKNSSKELCSSRNGTQAGLSFLDLPGEVRNKIYRLALVDDEERFCFYYDGTAITTLLRTCRQIYNEAFLIFYHENKFYLDERLPHFYRWWEDYIPFGFSTLRLTLVQDFYLYLSCTELHVLAYELRDIFVYFENSGCAFKKLCICFGQVFAGLQTCEEWEAKELKVVEDVINRASFSSVHEELKIEINDSHEMGLPIMRDMELHILRDMMHKVAKRKGWMVAAESSYESGPQEFEWTDAETAWLLRPA